MAISCIMSIPRREVKPDVDAAGRSRVDELSDNIALAVFPRASYDGVIGVLGRPQAEAIMVLCSEDDQRYAGLYGSVHPLVGVESHGVEYCGVFAPGSPFGVGEGVDAEVEEHNELSLLPFELGKGREG